jgi:hydrogenase maturation protease
MLLIGYGNPCRQDDGLGPAVAAAMEAARIPGLEVDSDYQLQVEDAHAMAGREVVVFADADATGREPFSFRRVEPGGAESFSTHSVRPPAVVGLARDLFGSRARAYLLGIRGYEFEMYEEKLTDKAAANLEAALGFLEPMLRTGAFEAALAQENS